MLRADLHVHSCYSKQSGNLRFLKSRDCYSRPEDVYRVAKSRGMDVVTITDHDTIDGCLALLDMLPDAGDVFISEEVSCRFPDADLEIHLGVYGVTEQIHRELQPLRRNVFEVTAALRERRVFFSLNHLLHFYRGQVPLGEYLRLLDEVPALETRNGTMLRAHNELVARIAARTRHRAVEGRPAGDGVAPPPVAPSRPRPPAAHVGGSDAHTLRRIGRTWTVVPGRTVEDFLASLARGESEVGGAHGSARCIAADAYTVIAAYVASLLGRGPQDHTALHRAACLLFSVVSLPAQVLPAVIAKTGKLAEAREVQRAASELTGWLDDAGGAAEAVEAQA